MQTVKFGASARHFSLLLLAAGTVLALFLWQGHKSFEMWDEGFLWYGVQRVLAGEAPFLDFMSYDPGRYYWSAALMALFGDDGILMLRGAAAVFQVLGLFIGLSLLVHNNPKPGRLFVSCGVLTLAVWMFPWFKLFDIIPSIMLVGGLSFLVQHPSVRRYLFAGIIVGLAAVFGRNHGLYGVVASLALMAYLAGAHSQGPGLVKAFVAWSTGVVIGYLPILFMMLAIPGFALAFWQGILFLFEVKATNLPLPVPWPWRVPFDQIKAFHAARGILIGSLFIAVIAFGVAGIAWSIRQRLRQRPVSPVLVAASFLSLPYAHYAYSRPDLVHLAQGIFPFLIGVFTLMAGQPAPVRRGLALALCGISLLIMVPVQPAWQCRVNGPCVEADVGGSRLMLEPGSINDLGLLNKLVEEFAPNQRSVIVAPYWPGAYAVLKRKSPMWENYALFPRSASFERAEIERIKRANPGFALIIDTPLDGREELRFKNTHPLIQQYINENFEFLKDYTSNPAVQIYKSRQAPQ